MPSDQGASTDAFVAGVWREVSNEGKIIVGFGVIAVLVGWS
jgi:hypothetical protein